MKSDFLEIDSRKEHDLYTPKETQGTREVTIIIKEQEELQRFRQSVKDCHGEKPDELLCIPLRKWFNEGLNIIKERVAAKVEEGGGVLKITMQMPDAWMIHSAPGMKYSLRELIYNGMMSGWYRDVKKDVAEKFRLAAELNKAELKSIIVSLDM